MNASGQVVGLGQVTGDVFQHAWLWNPVGGLVDLFGFGKNAGAYGINSRGQVVGWSDGPSGMVAFRWNPVTGMESLGKLGTGAVGTGINDAGQVMGYFFVNNAGDIRAFRWTSENGMQDLGTLGGTFSWPTSFNSVGDVVGYSPTSGSTGAHAFRWTAATGMQDLGTLGTGQRSEAWATNDAGVVIGNSETVPNANQHAFRWTSGGGMEDMGDFGGNFSRAVAINAAGQIVGYSTFADGKAHAFRWTAGEGMRDLGSLGRSSAATAINNAGQVVGWSDTPTGRHAFLWTEEDGMEDLFPFTSIVQPTSVSDNLYVVGVNGSGLPRVAGVTVNPNQPPVAEPMLVTTPVGTAVSTPLAASDPEGAALTFAVLSPPVHGTLSGVAPSMTYTPQPGYSGSDAFTFKVTDPKGLSSAAATVTITVANPGATATGTNFAVTPVDPATGAAPVTLTFATVTAPGTTTVTTSGTGAPPPLAFKMGAPPVYYELQTTATFSGTVTVCFGYTPSAFGNPSNLKLFHGGAGSSWTDVTTSNDPSAGKICGSVTTLSPFILAELHYDFAGFLQPVDNPGPTNNIVNTLKAGAAVPVKFSLGGNMGLNILATGSPASSAYTCGGGVEDAVEETVTAGGSSFTYDATAGQYVYVWKTDKAWAGTCRKLTVTLKDGTSRQALFKLTK
jgi:probable HAF family extracellular repeat protein